MQVARPHSVHSYQLLVEVLDLTTQVATLVAVVEAPVSLQSVVTEAEALEVREARYSVASGEQKA